MELTVLFGLLFGRKIIETSTKKRSRPEICSQIFTANHAAKTRCKSLVARWRSTFTTRFGWLRNRVAAQRQHQGICWYMVRNMRWTCYWLVQWSWILNFPIVNDQVISWFNAHVAETSHDSWRSPPSLGMQNLQMSRKSRNPRDHENAHWTWSQRSQMYILPKSEASCWLSLVKKMIGTDLFAWESNVTVLSFFGLHCYVYIYIYTCYTHPQNDRTVISH